MPTPSKRAKLQPQDEPQGVFCPTCGCERHRVIWVRDLREGRRRRLRECEYCGRRFTTIEKSV